ncbi:MAG: hypothetical protein Q8O95_05790 [bacterium]|nr:hypothetical protein [bacterium]
MKKLIIVIIIGLIAIALIMNYRKAPEKMEPATDAENIGVEVKVGEPGMENATSKDSENIGINIMVGEEGRESDSTNVGVGVEVK